MTKPTTTDCTGCGFDKSITDKINEMHLAVIGNPELGIIGLVSRVERVEKKQKRMLLQATFFVGILVGSFEGIKSFIINLFEPK